MDSFPDTSSYFDELARNTEAIENLQHSHAFDAVIRDHAIQSETTYVQGIMTRYDADTLPGEFTDNFFVPDHGTFEIKTAFLSEHKGMWNFNCRVDLNDTPFNISAQPGITTVQSPTYEGVRTKQLDGDIVHHLLATFTLATIEQFNAGSPPVTGRPDKMNDMEKIQVLLEALGNINGLTRTQTVAAFEQGRPMTDTGETASIERAMFIRLSHIESTTGSAVATSLDLGWQLFNDTATEMNVETQESMYPTESLEVHGQRGPISGPLSDYVLRKQFGDLFPLVPMDAIPHFISPRTNPVAWSHLATTFIKTLEPLMRPYAHLDE